jgi:hypothetical protein
MKAYWNCTKEQLEEMFGFREKGLTEEEKQRMIKDDIPKFRVIGDANLSEEELGQAEQDLDKIIKRLRKRAKNKNDRNKNT